PNSAPLPGERSTVFEAGDQLRPLPDARRLASDEFERQYLELALARADGNLTRAAEFAGVSYRVMQTLAAKHGVRIRKPWSSNQITGNAGGGSASRSNSISCSPRLPARLGVFSMAGVCLFDDVPLDHGASVSISRPSRSVVYETIWRIASSTAPWLMLHLRP